MADPDTAVAMLPAWFSARMMASRGAFGFLLTTGDVLRVSRVAAVHLSSTGKILVDVLLDRAGVPDGVDTAWRSKHFLGAPVTGAPIATVNLDHITMAVEFAAAEIVENPCNGADVSTLAALQLTVDHEEPSQSVTELSS